MNWEMVDATVIWWLGAAVGIGTVLTGMLLVQVCKMVAWLTLRLLKKLKYGS